MLSSQTDSTAQGDDFSVITIRKPYFRIYSEAYARFIANPIVVSFGDTTRFDERYLDYAYCRTTPKQFAFSGNRISNAWFRVVPLKKRADRRLLFSLKARTGLMEYAGRVRSSPEEPEMLHLFPEMRCFRKYDWILKEDVNRKAFRRFMRKNKWYDIRIEYSEGDDYYRMTFKGAESSVTFRVSPVRWTGKIFARWATPDLEKMYELYQKDLFKQRSRFDYRISREIRKAKNTEERQWKSLINNYFSEEEKRMSRNEWLDYCQMILFDEQRYLTDAPFTPLLFTRSLILNSYEMMVLPSGEVRSGSFFSTSCDNTPSMCQMTVLFNPNTLEYYPQTYNNNRKIPGLYYSLLNLESGYSILALLTDGTLLLQKSVPFNGEKGYFEMKGVCFIPGILTLREVWDYLEL